MNPREGARPEPRRFGDLIRDFLKSPVMARRGDMAELSEAWTRAAGAEVARRSRPVALKAGELMVNFASAAVRHEVEAFRKAEILARLKTELPGRRVASLRCVLQD